MISSSQRLLPDNTQHTQQTNIHAPGWIRTHDPSRRAAADLGLRPRGHWDRLVFGLWKYIDKIRCVIGGVCSYVLVILLGCYLLSLLVRQVENQGNISLNCCSLFTVSRKFRQFSLNTLPSGHAEMRDCSPMRC